MYFHDVDVRLKVHSVSRKSERLVNLTIALLATKRWLTKSQIFAAVEGYEGEPGAKERMFERDKDDLRSLGIEIEVGTFDPLFDDEVGYRIRPEQYKIDFSDISAQELSLITLATKMWKGAVLDSSALSALVKLKSLGVAPDFASLPSLIPRITTPSETLEVIVSSIADRRALTFQYRGTDLSITTRRIAPFGAGTKNGFWYLAGLDLDKSEMRLFRLDRIESTLSVAGKGDSYEIPNEFSMSEALASPEKIHSATLALRRNRAHALRASAIEVEDADDWTVVSYPYFNESQLIEDVLWHLDDVKVLEPQTVVEEIKRKLITLVEVHG